MLDQTGVIIIGGGPSGLFCAIVAVSRGISVLLLEKKQSCGRKLLITGSGQCNLTHEGDIREFFSRYGDHGKWIKPALLQFTNQDLIGFFEKHGIPMMTEREGKVFPKSRKATEIRDILVDECRGLGVKVQNDEPVLMVGKEGRRFSVTTPKGHYFSEMVCIATGGLSYPETGSEGDGLILARRLGHTIMPNGPALVGIRVKQFRFSDLSGISFENSRISLFRDDKKVSEHSGDLLITHTGLSGPVILNMSRYIRPGDLVKVSFIPGNNQELRLDIRQTLIEGGSALVKNLLYGYHLPERFVKRILVILDIPLDLTCSHLSKPKRAALITAILEFPFIVDDLGGYDEAMVTRGGVSLDEISLKTMESKIVPGLFIIGEVLDLDGDSGGYNLQAAFSTAYLAAQAMVGPKNPG